MPDAFLDDENKILEALDFKAEDECGNNDCSNRAVWRVVGVCCGEEWKRCDKCRQRTFSEWRKAPKRGCDTCGFRWDTRTTINRTWSRL